MINILNIKNSSFSFAKEISNFHSENKSAMASYDVHSLFTNFPFEGKVNIINDSLRKKLSLLVR